MHWKCKGVIDSTPVLPSNNDGWPELAINVLNWLKIIWYFVDLLLPDGWLLMAVYSSPNCRKGGGSTGESCYSDCVQSSRNTQYPPTDVRQLWSFKHLIMCRRKHILMLNLVFVSARLICVFILLKKISRSFAKDKILLW